MPTQTQTPHGVVSKYWHGCRCEPCRAAIARYQRDRRHRIALAEGRTLKRRHKGSTPRLRPDGYVELGTNIMLHRLVMEVMIGRPLRYDAEIKETVHHKNGIRYDNRPDNLELRVSGMHPAGQRVGDLVIFAREVLAAYGEVADRLAA